LFAPEITGSGRGLTTTSTVVVTGDPHPKVAVRRYLYVPGVFIVSLKVTPDPARGVQTLKGDTDLCQL